MGFIGFADAYGDSWLGEISARRRPRASRIVAEEKYNRNDPSVTGQVLKILAAQPDAVLIAGAGTPRQHPTRSSFRAATRERSIRRMALPTPTSFASSVPTATAASSRRPLARLRAAAG